MKIVYKSLAFILLFALFSTVLYAGSTGKISGVVKDKVSGELLPGANILIQGTTLGAVTNVDGQFVVLNVPPGRYGVAASLVGYKRIEVRDVKVSVDFTTKLDFTLEQGDIELDAIVVQGDRSPLIRQDLTNPVASISSETIQELPVTEISQVIGLQAGVTVDDDGSIHIRGGLGNEIAYSLNGMSLNNPYANTRSIGIATNAVREVSVSSGTFSAEYGSALSGVVNYVTKDGSSNWTGSFKSYGGDYLSSRDVVFFRTNTDFSGNERRFELGDVYRMEASLGGPILGDDLTFYGSGVYNYNSGYLYGVQLYNPTDSYVSPRTFPSGDPRVGATTDPLYFAPLLHASTDAQGTPTGNGDIVDLNWSRSYNLQGNLSYRLASDMKLKYEFIYDNVLNPASSSSAYRFRPDGRALANSESWFQSIDFTHSVSDRMFYTVKGSYIVDIGKTRTYDAWDDPRYLPSFYQQVLPGTNFLTGGTDLSRFYRKSTMWSGKFDLVAQLFNIHEFKFGVELRSHILDVESYTLRFRHPVNRDLTPSFEDAIANGTVYVPYIPNATEGYVNYRRKPLQLAGYIQDKIELFESIILNLGVRYEYFDPAAQYNPLISDEYGFIDSTNFYVQNLQDATPKHMVSPRISVSYPITDRGTIRFSYGHFYQIGSLASLYSNPNYRALLGTTPSFGNADVNPQRSVQYEIGLQQGLTDDLKVELTGYYKDVKDYIYSQSIFTERADRSFNLLTNLSYANTRGVSLSLLKRRSPGSVFSASIDYTFQIAEGNRTEPTDEIFFNEQQGRLSETYLVPFSFDRSHTITSTVTLSQPNDWSASLIGYLRTGTPYTPAFPSNVVPITFIQNSDRQPVQWNVDLKLEKFFLVGPMTYSVFLQVDNLFDTENESFVYASTGRALTDISETLDPFRFADLQRRIDRGDPGLIPAEVLDSYYADPRNLNPPRLVRFGVSVTF